MPDSLPAFLDLSRIGEVPSNLEGCLEPGQLPRLRAVARLNDAVRVRLRVAEEGGHRLVKGNVRAELGLTCQRCLGPLLWPVAADFCLVWKRDSAAIEHLPEAYDAIVSASGRANLAGMIEDELLLALPLVPRHEPAEKCADLRLPTEQRHPQVVDNAAPGPFAVLRALKRR